MKICDRLLVLLVRRMRVLLIVQQVALQVVGERLRHSAVRHVAVLVRPCRCGQRHQRVVGVGVRAMIHIAHDVLLAGQALGTNADHLILIGHVPLALQLLLLLLLELMLLLHVLLLQMVLLLQHMLLLRLLVWMVRLRLMVRQLVLMLRQLVLLLRQLMLLLW